ncbi:MAG: hypothetical protein ACRD1T_24155 [Acidimicrobiia bacterium]
MAKKRSEIPILKQAVPGLGLSLERGTAAVPADGAYYVILNGKIVLRSVSKARALAEYRSRRQTLMRSSSGSTRQIDREAVLKRARAEIDFKALHSEAAHRKASKARRKGGKGGSGGVGR